MKASRPGCWCGFFPQTLSLKGRGENPATSGATEATAGAAYPREQYVRDPGKGSFSPLATAWAALHSKIAEQE